MRKRCIFVSLATLTVALSMPAYAAKTMGERVDDTTINASIKAALLDDKNTHATKINVETYKGVVQLSGFVSSEAEKAEAARVAQRVSGVKDVHNDIEIHPDTSMGTKLEDTMLTGKVKAALMDAADVKSGQINVESKGGVVQLAGFVTSDDMRSRAEEVTKRVSGVKSVDNALLIKPKL